MAPVTMYGQLRHVDLQMHEDLNLEGVGDASSKTFFLEEVVIRSKGAVNLNAAKLKISGQVWLDGGRGSKRPGCFRSRSHTARPMGGVRR